VQSFEPMNPKAKSQFFQHKLMSDSKSVAFLGYQVYNFDSQSFDSFTYMLARFNKNRDLMFYKKFSKKILILFP